MKPNLTYQPVSRVNAQPGLARALNNPAELEAAVAWDPPMAAIASQHAKAHEQRQLECILSPLRSTAP